MTRPRPLRSLLPFAAALLLVPVVSAPGGADAEVRRRARHLPAQRDAEPLAPRGVARSPPCSRRAPASTTSSTTIRPRSRRASTRIIPELAERWSWQDNHRNLVFFLRQDVKWHDGKPFTSQDVKYTFDVVRGRARRQGQAQGEPAQALVREHRGHRGARCRTRWCSGSSSRSPRSCPCSPPATRRSIRPTCRWPSSRTVRRHRAVQAQGEQARRVHRVREEPRLLRQGPAVPRRDQVRDHPRPLHADRRAAVRASSTWRAAAGTGPTPRTPRRARPSWSCRDRQQRQRQRPHQLQEAAVHRPARPPRHQPRPRPQGLPGRARARARPPSAARCCPRPAGVWGLPAAEVAKLARHGRSRQAEGRGEEAPRRGRLRARQSAEAHGVHARARHLRRHRELDGRPAPAGRDRGHARADRDRRVAPEDDAPRVPGGAQPHRRRHRRSRRPALRELPLRLAAELLRLLLGGDRPAHGRAVADARPGQAPGARQRDRPQAAGRRRAADPRLGQAALGALAPRQGLGRCTRTRSTTCAAARTSGSTSSERGEGAAHADLRHQAARRSPASRCWGCRCSSSSSCAWRPATSPTSSSSRRATSTRRTRSASRSSWASTSPSPVQYVALAAATSCAAISASRTATTCPRGRSSSRACP